MKTACALFLLAVCVTLVTCADEEGTVRIGLNKIRRSKEQNDIFLKEALQRHATRTPMRFPKFENRLDMNGNFIPYPTEKPEAPAASSSTGYEHMTNYEEEVWVGNISIGSPAQGYFPVVLDTGSANLWVASVTCYDPGCNNKERFNSADSTTFVNDEELFFVPYGTGFVIGNLGNDTVQVAGLTVENNKFGVADYMADFFEYEPISGIMGMAFSDITLPPGIPTVFDNMVSQGVIANNYFSVYLDSSLDNDTNSFLLFGGIDSDYYTGEITYHNVELPSYWLLGMDATYVNGQLSHKCDFDYCLIVIDTGTTVLAGPEGDIDPMIESIGTVNPDCSNLDSLPTLSFEINNIMYDVEPEIYVLQYETTGGLNCTLGVESIPTIPGNPPMWILGDPFIRSYYSIFDKSTEPPRVGFAKATSPSSN